MIGWGGIFEDLSENLSYLAKFHRGGSEPKVRLDFFVQARNFRQMAATIDLTRDHGFESPRLLDPDVTASGSVESG